MVELRELSPLQTLLDARPAPALRALAALIITCVSSAVAWAALTPARVVVAGVARVRPAQGAARGFLDEPSARAVAPFAGVLAEVWGHDGLRVEPGTPLFRLETERLDRELARAEAQLQTRERELLLLDQTEERLRALAAAARARADAELEATTRELARATAEHQAAVRLAALADAEAQAEGARVERLFAMGAVGPVELERARADRARRAEELNRARASAPVDRRVVLAAQRDELAQQSALELLAVANRRLAARAARDEQRAAAEAARLDRERAVVRAEVGGTVASEGRASVRDSVDAGAAVMTLTPAGPLRVDAAIPAADVTAVSMGAPARVILEGHEVNGRTVVHGRVRYIAADSERVAALGGHVFVVSIALEDGAALRAGMTGRAEIEVARRSLLRLLLEHLSHRLALG